MKEKLLFLLIVISQLSFAQSPQSFKYQAVVRGAAGVLSVNKIISIKTSVLAGSTTGSSVYTETQILSTNEYGVVSLNIGAGTLVSGNFSTINWGTTTYFVKTELDINGGSTYVFMGTSQILSVPYALYAEKTGSSLSDHDTSATNELQTLFISGKNLSISDENTVVLPQDSLSIAGHTLSITNGNTVNLPAPQTISIVGDSLHISNANSIYLSGSVDLDASPTNELQNLSLNNDTLKISMGNNVVFPHDNDMDSINEIQSLSIVGHTLTISKANSITIPPDADNSITNELQTLSLNQGTFGISQGNIIHLPDSSSTNELQTLSVTNDTLITISNGNSAYINTSRSLKFPEGVDGTPITLQNISGTPIYYTVPTGKNLYLTNQWFNGSNNIYGNPVYPPGTILSLTNPSLLTGLLINQTSNIQIIFTNVTSTSTYIVPSGKNLYVKSFIGGGFNATLPNGAIYTGAYDEKAEILIFPSGTIISGPNTYFQLTISGYLK